jgi:hypothetical protein
MHSHNKSSQHPQTRVKCPHDSISDESHDAVAVAPSDAEHCHGEGHQGVEYSTPPPMVPGSHHLPVPALVTDLSTARPPLIW